MKTIPLTIFLWIVLSLSACTALPATTLPSPPPSKPQVGAITAIPSETSTPEKKSTEFVTATPVRTGPTLLTQGVESDSASFVRWFPDGKRIVFSSYEGVTTDHFQFYAVNSDGSGLQALKEIPVNARTLKWSPDGTKILFCAFLPDSQKETMFLISSDGTNLTRLTNKQIDGLELSASRKKTPHRASR